MLLWLAAAAAPWLIHLWLRKRQQVIDWGAMQWMLQALQRHSRPLRFWQWLLLVLRTLALMLLALAVAQPLGCRMLKSPEEQALRLHLLVLDASGSMQTKYPSGETRWQRAIEEATAVCDQAAAGDQFVVLRMESVPEYLIAEPTGDVAAVKQELEQSRCGCSVADWEATEKVLVSLVEKWKAVEERRKVQVTLWSDAQRATWETSADLQLQKNPLGSFDSVELRNLSDSAPVSNIAVASIGLPAQIPVAAETIQVQAVLHNFGDRAADHKVVRLSVDGAVRDSQVVSLASNTDQTVSFELKLQAGERILKMETDPDALTVDDQRWEVITIHDRIRVALLGSEEATQMLATALVPDPADTAFEVISGRVDDANLMKQQNGLIFLCDPDRIRSDTVQAMGEQVLQGASIWYWAGPRAKVSLMNRLLWEQSRPPLLPARLGAVAQADVYRVDPLEYKHPILAAFANYPDAGLTTIPVFRYRHFDNVAAEAQNVLAIAQGDPFCIVVPRVNGGSVGCIAVPADVGREGAEAWTGFAAWPSFVPFVQSLCRWSLTQGQARSTTIGEPLVGRGGESIELEKPDGAVQHLMTTATEMGNTWRVSRTEQVGIYRYHDAVQDRVLAVNADLAESDLRTVDWEQVNQRYAETGDASVKSEPGAQEWVQHPLFRYVLGGSLGFLLLEMSVIAWLQRRFR